MSVAAPKQQAPARKNDVQTPSEEGRGQRKPAKVRGFFRLQAETYSKPALHGRIGLKNNDKTDTGRLVTGRTRLDEIKPSSDPEHRNPLPPFLCAWQGRLPVSGSVREVLVYVGNALVEGLEDIERLYLVHVDRDAGHFRVDASLRADHPDHVDVVHLLAYVLVVLVEGEYWQFLELAVDVAQEVGDVYCEGENTRDFSRGMNRPFMC